MPSAVSLIPRRKVAGENPVRMYENGDGAGIDFLTPTPRYAAW